MPSTNAKDVSFMTKVLWFIVPVLSAYYLGNTMYILEILVVFVIGNTITQKDFPGDILFSITFGAFVGSTIGQMYTEEPFTWSMFFVLLMLVWWAKDSNYSQETGDIVVKFTNCWFFAKIFITAVTVKNYILKVLLITILSVLVKYHKFIGNNGYNKDIVKDTLGACIFAAIIGMLLKIIQNLIIGQELIALEDSSSFRIVSIIILFMCGYKHYVAATSETLKDCFIVCFIFLAMSLLVFSAFIIHPLFMVVMFPLTSAGLGFSFYDHDTERTKVLQEYILGPCCFSAASGIFIWTFKDYMEAHH